MSTPVITRNFSCVVSFGGITGTFAGSLTGSAESRVGVTVPDSTTNAEFDVSWYAAGIKGWILKATGGNLTVTTNNSGSPVNTFNLVDGSPQFFFTGAGPTDSIVTSVTKFFLTNASGGAVQFDAYALYTSP